MILTITSCEAERNLSKLSVIKKQILIKHARGKAELSFNSIHRKNITKLSLMKKQSKNMQSKNTINECYRGVSGS